MRSEIHTVLFRERLPALADSAAAPELVLLHGWAADCSVWRSALPLLRQYFNVTLIDLPGHGQSPSLGESSVQRLIDLLLPLLPEKAIYLGWSLGGMLATQLAARCPRRVTALVSVAANVSFVARENWTCALPAQTLADFLDGLNTDPERTLRRFHALQLRGDEREKELLREQRRLEVAAPAPEGLAPGLQWLGELDNRLALKALQCPVLHVLGECDALVPVAAAEGIATLCPEQRVLSLPGVAHQPFSSEPDAFWANVFSFFRDQHLIAPAPTAAIDKQQIARSFSRAAETYDSVAGLQRKVADQLLNCLPDGAMASTLLDLGCGTGYSLPALHRLCDRLLALDLAEGMLGYARQQSGRTAEAWLCADAENLPLADDSVDAVFSSLSVQWCENLGAMFAESYRVLRPGGSMVLSTLGPKTLHELRSAWQAVDDLAHVNRFAERDNVERAIALSGLQLCSWQEQMEVLHYRELRELMAELKQLGAHNLNAGRPSGLMGKQRLRRFVAGYEAFREADGTLPASYQVWYLVLEKPVSAETVTD